MTSRILVNVGCGKSPTPGWLNFDGSHAIRLARHPLLCFFLARARLINAGNRSYIAFAKQADVRWADVTRHIPLPDSSVDALYSCHMLEHLDREEAKLFLAETLRVLKPGGIVRIGVPDFSVAVKEYWEEHHDADKLIARTMMSQPRPKGLREVLKSITSGGSHRWMYDGNSLVRLITNSGFRDVQVLPAGSSLIEQPGALNLRERELGTVYVEGCHP